ncbi:MAG: DUF1549 domain-containing protein, partial [Verrucomicrobiota bacterium]
DPEKGKIPAHQRIDRLVLSVLHKEGVQPNARVSDEVFVRRIYLDIVGRVPTKQEALAFLEDPAKQKRTKLVDQLLASDGYVHHFYHFWADLLRAKTQVSGAGNSRGAGYAYQDWIRTALQENKPYDQMVYELISASGRAWENGAVGYYLRDYGMPLDNLAMTMQVFLGTQIVCAQCHNHPFDDWTQMDYYHLSAFTYGMVTTNGSANASAATRLYGKEVNASAEERRVFSRAMSEVLKPVRFNTVEESKRNLRLPHDYQYDDAKPKSVVKPQVPWGDQPKLSSEDIPIHEFATWMTSPENARFTRVIANRLWKKAMGRGIIEPADDFTQHTQPGNPELMDYLERRLVALDYDMKKFLRSIYLSDTYQREASTRDVSPWEPYHFEGPLLRRLTAEQIWDSLVAMIVDQPDRFSKFSELRRERLLTQAEWVGAGVYDQTPEELLEFGRQIVAKQAELSERIAAAQEEITDAREAEDPKRIREALATSSLLRGELAEMVATTVYREGLEEKIAELGEDPTLVSSSAFFAELSEVIDAEGNLMMPDPPKKPSRSNGFDGGQFLQGLLNRVFYDEFAGLLETYNARKSSEKEAWGIKTAIQEKHYQSFEKQRRDFLRASDIASPAPNGHFLREFGQSDRELVENANDQASITQALALLNGPINNALLHGYSLLSRELREDSLPVERLETIYLTMLSRKPTKEEKAILLPLLREQGSDGLREAIWAILNTRQFLFVQ